MEQTIDIQAIAKLSVEQRLKLIEQIWDTLNEQDLPPLSESQWAEIQRRIDAYRRDPSSAMSHDEFMAKLRSLK